MIDKANYSSLPGIHSLRTQETDSQLTWLSYFWKLIRLLQFSYSFSPCKKPTVVPHQELLYS